MKYFFKKKTDGIWYLVFGMNYKDSLLDTKYYKLNTSGFTLIETLVAISILVVAVVAPMSLAAQSLSTAFYARDQVTAFHLAQEGIEVVRAQRDGNALQVAHGGTADLLAGIPVDQDFIVDTHDGTITACSTLPNGVCTVLQNNGQFYGYGTSATGWNDTRFTRTLRASRVRGTEEIKVAVTIGWRSGAYQPRSFTISENLFRWVDTGTAG